MILIGGKAYELIADHKNGWNQEVFRERYNEVLDRYDYIVGDWGYNQLRLRGFFKENNPKATKDSSITCLQDYLNEYCNFGCAYFVLERVPGKNAGPGEGPDFADEASLREETTAAQEDMPRYTIRSQPAPERGGQRAQQGAAGPQDDKTGPSGLPGAQPPQGQQGSRPQHRQNGQQGPQGGQQGQRPQQGGRPQSQGQHGGGRQGQQQGSRQQGGVNQHGPRAQVSAQNQGYGNQQPGHSQGHKQHNYQGSRHGQRPNAQGGSHQQRGGNGHPGGRQQPAAPDPAGGDV
jgi:uncharacterized protein YutD